MVVLIAVIGGGFLGLFTYLKNPKSATNILFFAFTITLTIYNLFNYLALHQSDDAATLFWIRTIISIALFINLLFFLLVKAFPQTKIEIKNFILWPAVVFTLLLLPLTQTDIIFKTVKPSTTEPIAGTGMPLFILHNLIFLGGGFFVLLRKFRKSYGVSRAQLRLFVTGAILMFILILITNFLFVILFNTSAFVGLLPLYTLIFVGFISYAIVKHRFLDIGLVVARTVSYTLLIGLFGVLYAILFAAISSILVGASMGTRTILISTILALLMAFSFQSIRKVIEKITDRIFYKNHYDTSKLLYDLALVMASTLRLEDLTHQILQKILKEVKVTRGTFILVEDNHVYEVAHEGYSKTPEIDEAGILKLFGGNKVLIFEELPEGDVKEIMRNMEFTIVVPLITEGEYMGIFALGEKLSGDIYTSEDIRVVEIISPEATVAIQNAKAYEEIRRFNITLREEVERATKDLQVANTKLKELDKLKDDFVSVASHELRTPMTAIKSYLWMALKKPDAPLSEKMNKYLSRAYISTERLINLVNDMLNVSRIEAGTIEIRPSLFDIQSLVEDVISEVKPKADEKMIRLEVVKTQVPQIFADPDKVHQVLLNLLGNSLKFTHADGVISTSFFSDGRVVEISVKDNGVGISKDDLSRLFQKFGRLDNSYVAAATSGGTGLGLFISKSLVELMGGKIWASSEGLGKGTTFTFALPVATPEVLSQAERYTKKVVGEVKQLEPVTL